MTLVGYRGAAPALKDVIGGQIDGVCDCRRLGVAGDRRQAGEGPRRRLDDAACNPARLPTSAEAGLPDFQAQGWNGLFAPKGTPPAVSRNSTPPRRAAVDSEAVKKRFHDLSTVAPDADELAPEVLGQLVTRDVAKYKKLLEEKK